MGRLRSSPNKNQLSLIQPIQEQAISIAEARINGGLVTELDPADIENNQARVLRNFRIQADKTIRSPGKSSITPAKPDSNRVLLYTTFERFDKTSVNLRFTATTVQKNTGSGWTTLTTSTALTATDDAIISFAVVNDRFFFSNGVDPIQEINSAVTTYDALGNADNYQYICGFFNRIIGASTPDNPVIIARSGDLDFDEWNPAVNISAGNDSLIEGQSDFAEPITGLFGFAAVMLILREKSLWIASKLPSSTKPFLYTAAFPGTGCDCPRSAAQTGNGVTWYDQRTSQVYDYRLNGAPEPIGTAIRSWLRTLVTDKNQVFGCYDSILNQYVLCITSGNSDTSSVICYDYQTRAWYYEEVEKCVGVFNLNDTGLTLTIGDLVGTIGSLSGTIGDLEYGNVIIPARLYATSDGDILQDDNTIDTTNGEVMTSEFISKIISVPVDDVNITEVVVKYIPRRAGSFTVQFTRNKGETWESYKTVEFDGNARRQTSIFRKNVRAEEYSFRIISTEGQFDLLEFNINGVTTADKSEDE